MTFETPEMAEMRGLAGTVSLSLIVPMVLRRSPAVARPGSSSQLANRLQLMFRNLFLALVMTATPPLAQAALAKQHILFVSPHPDDEVLGTGAQIWKAQQRGDDYKVVIVTSGDAYD